MKSCLQVQHNKMTLHQCFYLGMIFVFLAAPNQCGPVFVLGLPIWRIQTEQQLLSLVCHKVHMIRNLLNSNSNKLLGSKMLYVY